jgi:ApaG protein
LNQRSADIVSEKSNYLEPAGLRVTVDRVVYHPRTDAPPERPHCFVYFITIHNGTELSVTIKARKWVVTNERGEVSALEGEGVVGQSPMIEAGESFSYNSFHMLDTTSAVAEGSYLGLDSLGRRVIARIPKFQMQVPRQGVSGRFGKPV